MNQAVSEGDESKRPLCPAQCIVADFCLGICNNNIVSCGFPRKSDPVKADLLRL